MKLWRRRERRQDHGYTADRVAAAVAAASGQTGDASAIAAAEIAAGQWGRAFASAKVEPETPATAALTPDVLAIIGRSLVRSGEALFELAVRDGMLFLDPVGWWDVHGEPDPRTWEYHLTLAGPTTTVMRRVGADRVIHPRYAVAPGEPWRGLSPLAVQSSTSGLAAILEQRLREEASGQVGNLIALPSTADSTSFETGIANLRGKTLLVPTTAGGWEAGPDAQPRRDWWPQRLGATPPDSLVNLRSDSTLQVLAACGVPVELVQRSDGTALRESWRQFLHGTVQPVGKMIARELGAKLDAPDLRLNFDDLMASDLSGRARAFQSMVNGGMDVPKAAQLSGLMEAEE